MPVLLTSGNEAALVAAAETLEDSRLVDLRALSADLVLAVTARRAETLKARAYDGDLARIVLPAEAGSGWIGSVADPADDLGSPMKGPFQTIRGGNADLCRAALRLIKSARLLPAAVVVGGEAARAAGIAAGLVELSASSIITADRSELEEVVSARVPLQVSEAGRLRIFRPHDGGEEHYAVEIGNPDRSQPVLTRLHSSCFTGDLLGSLKCDCGPQLRAALAQMGAEGAGILLYLNQEGRGIGLANKMRAYALQDQGFDTVEANHRLGFEDDERDFRIGSDILRRLGFSSIRLMTNNPAKVDRMIENGIAVTERVPLKVGHNPHNHGYLQTKAEKSGHLM